MNFTFRLMFRGVWAFVPVDDNGRPVAMHVLAIDARDASDPFVQHFPSLQFRVSDHYGEIASPTVTVEDGVASWPLDRDDLEITAVCAEIDDSTGFRIRTGRRFGLRRPTNVDEAADFSWLPILRAVQPTRGLDINNDLMNPASTHFWDNVAARIVLDNGTLGSEPSSITDSPFEFRTLDTSQNPPVLVENSLVLEQAIALVQCCEFVVRAAEGAAEDGGPCDLPQIHIRSNSRPDDPGVTLRPSFGHTLEVVLENMPHTDARAATDPLTDPDFALVYRVAKVAPERQIVPTLKTNLGSKKAPCGGAGYNSVPLVTLGSGD